MSSTTHLLPLSKKSRGRRLFSPPPRRNHLLRNSSASFSVISSRTSTSSKVCPPFCGFYPAYFESDSYLLRFGGVKSRVPMVLPNLRDGISATYSTASPPSQRGGVGSP